MYVQYLGDLTNSTPFSCPISEPVEKSNKSQLMKTKILSSLLIKDRLKAVA